MKVGFALRSSVFHPSLIGELARVLDGEGIDSIWFPDVGQSVDAIDLCAVALASTRRVRVGTGVIRAGEQDPARLAVRARTLNDSSGGRFVLGLGAGRERGPSAVRAVADTSERFKTAYGKGFPPVFFAALRRIMLHAAVSSADGVILNFCPPSYVQRMLSNERRGSFTVACYVKLFFSDRGESAAKKMLVDEMSAYNRLQGYHKMFEEAGVAELIAGLEPEADNLPEPLQEVALANPSPGAVEGLLKRFVAAGVGLPIVYPYVSGDSAYQRDVVRGLASTSSAVKPP